jgi:hypothetical protein
MFAGAESTRHVRPWTARAAFSEPPALGQVKTGDQVHLRSRRASPGVVGKRAMSP